MNRAAVDIGTNSVRLLVVDGNGDEIIRREVVTGLGRGVEAGRRFDPDALARTLETLSSYRGLIRAHGASRCRAIATSAARDADDRLGFLDAVEQALGVRPDVISGVEEAALALEGAATGFPTGTRLLIIDIGGGSTEFARDGSATSVDIGSVRLTERHLSERPAGYEQLETAAQACRSLFGTVQPAPGDCTVVGVAGTWTSLAAIDSGIGRYDRSVVHHYRLGRTSVDRMVMRLARLSAAETASLPGLEPARAPVILAGAVVAREAMRALAIDSILVSELDSLDGVVARLGA